MASLFLSVCTCMKPHSGCDWSHKGKPLTATFCRTTPHPGTNRSWGDRPSGLTCGSPDATVGPATATSGTSATRKLPTSMSWRTDRALGATRTRRMGEKVEKHSLFSQLFLLLPFSWSERDKAILNKIMALKTVTFLHIPFCASSETLEVMWRVCDPQKWTLLEFFFLLPRIKTTLERAV